MRETILTHLTAWLKRKWTGQWCQTTRKRTWIGSARTIRTQLRTSQRKSKDSAISKSTIQSTCRNRKCRPKENKCSQLLSSQTQTHLNCKIWEQIHKIWKIFSEWKKYCPVTFFWQVKESTKSVMGPFMMMRKKTLMRWLTSCRRVGRSQRQNRKALNKKVWRRTDRIPLMRTSLTSKFASQSKVLAPGLISLKISKIPLGPKSHLTAISSQTKW